MKAERLFFTPSMALILKLIGTLLIAATLLDYLVVTVPPNFLNSEWITDWISEWVTRGPVPLLGVSILFLGIWIERSHHSETGRALGGLATGSLILSGILGVLFLVMAPLYFNNSRLTSAAQTRQINEQAARAEQVLDNLLVQQRDRVDALLSDSQQLAALQQQLENADLSEEQQAELRRIQTTLQRVQSDPEALDQEVEKARAEGLKQIEDRQQQALDALQSEQRRTRFQTTVSSLLFAAGYLSIAWAGLSSTNPKAATRTKSRRR
ncbi:MAG: hypothetical protein IGS38_08905 [Synechococcales cyanobacterium M58_A2018_015]|nr:hypothetical protein [Synechococcales cyanobacterium M58_A2018_015]